MLVDSSSSKPETPPSKFDSLPTETVGDIFCQLDLESVFTLSRLSKRLYRFLRMPTSNYIWEAACKNVQMPELTAPGWTLPGLANLCYGCCQVCGSSALHSNFRLRVRYCLHPCLEKL
ncbi:hypothetical protein JCM10207_004515 [Rhodosporidiobolus poonsookiae]